MINQLPFTQLTRFGMPQFRVIRRPIEFANELLEVGKPVSSELQNHGVRLRQYYDQRRIEAIPETIPQAPAKGRPASEAAIPDVVLEQQAMESTGIDTGVFADVVPGIEMPVEIEEVRALPVPQRNNRRR